VYQGTGLVVSARVIQVAQARFSYVQLLDAKEEQAAFDECKSRHGRFLIVPRLVHWEERAMNWSGRPDHIKIQLALRDTQDDAFTRLVLFEGKQGHGLHFTDTPAEDLLTDRFDEGVLLLLGVGASPWS
jgi:hypothetical protein